MPYLYITIYRNFIVRDKNLDTIEFSLKGDCTKIVVYLSSEMVLSNKREQTADKHINTQKCQKHAEWKKLYTKTYKLYVYTLINSRREKIIPQWKTADQWLFENINCRGKQELWRNDIYFLYHDFSASYVHTFIKTHWM